MAIQATNTVASQALRGQAVKVTMDQGEAEVIIPQLLEGMPVTIDSSGFTGTINRIDTLGYSFWATPDMPTGNLSSDETPGILNVDELINIEN